MHTCLTWKIAANLSLSRRAQSRGFDPLTATYFAILQIKNNEGATPSTGIRRRSAQDVLLLSDTVRLQGWRGRNKTFVVSVFSPSIIRAPSTSLAGGRLHSNPERRPSSNRPCGRFQLYLRGRCLVSRKRGPSLRSLPCFDHHKFPSGGHNLGACLTGARMDHESVSSPRVRQPSRSLQAFTSFERFFTCSDLQKPL